MQTVAAYKFYQISNQALARNINTQFAAFQTTQNNYPFIVSIIGMNVRYPQNTMQVNDTLGIKLLKETSKLSQLDSQLTLLQNYIGNYSQLIQNYVLMQVNWLLVRLRMQARWRAGRNLQNWPTRNGLRVCR